MKSNYFNSEKVNAGQSINALIMFVVSLLLVLTNLQQASAITYYSNASGLWNTLSTWRILSGGTWVTPGVLPGAADDINISGGHTVQINDSRSCNNLYVGNGGIGTLEFITGTSGGRIYSLTVKNNAVVSPNSTIRYGATAINIYRLRIGKNLTNGGTINLTSSVPASNRVDLEFYYDATTQSGSIVDKVTGSMPVWTLSDVIINKTPATNWVDVRDNGFETGIRTLIGTSGVYIHNNTGTYSVNAGAAFTIVPAMTFRIPQGTMNFAAASNILTLQGALEVTGGTVNVGSTAGIEGIRSEKPTTSTITPWLNVTSGLLNVYGGITNLSTSGTPFMISMSGGTMNLNTGTTGCTREILKVYDIAGSRFDMSGGTIVLRKPNTTAGYSVPDVYLCGANIDNTITGGTIQFGNGAITKGFSFYPYYAANTTKTYPNFVVSSAPPAGSWTVAPMNSNSFCVYSLWINTGSNFNMIPWGSASGSATMHLTGVNTTTPSWTLAIDGTYNTSNSTVSFAGSMRQYAGSPSGSTPTLYNLSVSNSNHVELRSNINLSNYLSMNQGTLVTYYDYNFTPAQTAQHKLLTCLSNCQTNTGSASSYVDGPMVHTVVAPNTTTAVVKYYPIGKAGQFRPIGVNLIHLNTASTTYMSEVINSPACIAPTLVPATLQGVSRVRYYQFWKTGGANFSQGNIRMYYGSDDGITDPATAMVGENNFNYNNCSTLIGGGSSTWIAYGNSVTNSNFGPALAMPYVEKSLDNWRAFRSPAGLSNYQPSFALANPPGGANALPISLMEFNARLSGNKVQVTWTTQTELNNDFFTIERSRDNMNYEPIGFVNGAGTSNAIHQYSYTDVNPLYGISFYRLRQTDFDGQSEYFSSIPISNRKSGFTVYPNPCEKPVVNVSISSDRMADYRFEVRDLLGREVPFKAASGANGDIELSLDESVTKHGSFYIVYANDGVETVQQKFMVK